MRAPSWFFCLAIVGTVGLASAATGCKGSSGNGPTDASAADNRAADQRLQGNWRIVDFRPENALDASMAAMLASYQNNMIVQMQNGRMRAITSGQSINFDRRYEIKEALGQRFHLVVYDDAGVAQTNYCEFQPDGSLRVKTQTPWRGDALLGRAQ